jgi:hypothetical protein
MEEMKKKVNFNINVEVLKEFNKNAKEKAINKSQFIENFMKQWIQENK